MENVFNNAENAPKYRPTARHFRKIFFMWLDVCSELLTRVQLTAVIIVRISYVISVHGVQEKYLKQQ